MALPAGRAPSRDSATQVRRYQPPSGGGASWSAAMSDSPERTAPVCRASVGGQAQGVGDGDGMRSRAAEEGATALRPLDEEVAVVFPGVTNTAEGLDRFAADQALAVVTGGLGH